jgi:hypothetical protein
MVAPKLNRRRALFVLDKIDEIVAWEKTKEREKDVRFVDLGRYLWSYLLYSIRVLACEPIRALGIVVGGTAQTTEGCSPDVYSELSLVGTAMRAA